MLRVLFTGGALSTLRMIFLWTRSFQSGPGGLSRECILRIPMRVVKGDKMGRRNIAQVADTA